MAGAAAGAEGASVRRLRRKVPRGLLAAALAPIGVAPLVLAMFGGWTVPSHGPPSTLAEPTLFIIVQPSSGMVTRQTSSNHMSKVVRRAGSAMDQPGGQPKGPDGTPVFDASSEPRFVDDGTWTYEAQVDQIQKFKAQMKGRKGKFIPYGSKPWDPPRFKKVTIQARLAPDQASNTKIINQVVEEIRRISGAHPKIITAKTSVAAYNLREGAKCGVAVSITRQAMRDFLARLNTIILPRVRDFEGLWPNSFDNHGNYWLGFQNQEPFKELDEMIDQRELIHGFDVGIINNCFTQPDALKLMKDYGFPFNDKVKTWKSSYPWGSPGGRR